MSVQPIGWEDSAMAARRRIKHTATFEERLAKEATSHINKWLRSPRRQPPKALENMASDPKK
jgi:hypothetical protein